MNLNINDDRLFENVDHGTLRDEVKQLAYGSFLILFQADEEYIQMYHNEDGSFDVEYREGSYTKHYRLLSLLKNHEIFQLFLNYLDSNHIENTKLDWEKLEFEADFEGDFCFEESYLIDDKEYRKISIEDAHSCVIDGECFECKMPVGAYHAPECDQEECPACHGVLAECGCT